MLGTRSWPARFLFLAGVLLLYTGTAVACYTMPRNLARPHAAVVAEAKQIFWAEVLSAEPAGQVGKAPKAVRYKLQVLRVLKGQVGSTADLDGRGELSGIWDTTFNNHAEGDFWSRSAGRMGVQGDCSMAPPHFVIGERYLVVISGSDDTKQFERVDSESDRWLKYVESKTIGDR